jgi:hypothetical protein
MQIDDFLYLARDAYIRELNESDQGREYLENCWRLGQTEPDRESIRSHFKKVKNSRKESNNV